MAFAPQPVPDVPALSQHPLTSAACGRAGEEVSQPPLMTNGLVEKELDHAGPGQGILGLQNELGIGLT